jgi:MFS transporter, OPA family, solute carrier family 37 (glycerol-3-phosphate transporter), member 1/2
MYHASRKPPSVVKTVLTGDLDAPSSSGWAPFNGSGGTGLLGTVDMAFLILYALGMFYCGHLGDRLDLRHLLSFGMMLSGISASLFGLGFLQGIHSFWFDPNMHVPAQCAMSCSTHRGAECTSKSA